MKYSFLVAVREFLEHAKTKGFWIGIFMVPLILTASIKVPLLLEKFARQARHFAVIDPTGEFGPTIDAAIQEYSAKKRDVAFKQWEEQKKHDPSTPAFEEPKPLFVHIPLPPDVAAASPADRREACKPYLLGKKSIQVDGRDTELFALIVLPDDAASMANGVEYWSTNLADDELQDLASRGLKKELQRREFDKSGLDRAKVESINNINVDLAQRDPKKEAGKEAVGDIEKIRQWAPVAFVYVLFISIMTVSQMLLSSTIEEKSNRIVEVLLSSVTPSELMFGKLLGVAGIGVTMLVAWFGFGWLVLQSSGSGAGRAGAFMVAVRAALVDPELLVSFVVYFLLGYLLYASILLALGSLCNTIKDAQNFMGPVMMVLIIPLLTMVFVAKDPNGSLAVILSWIPFFTPFVMMNRAAASPPIGEVLGTMGLLLATLVLVIWLAGRIFRNGILRTGQPPKFFEIFKLLRA